MILYVPNRSKYIFDLARILTNSQNRNKLFLEKIHYYFAKQVNYFIQTNQLFFQQPFKQTVYFLDKIIYFQSKIVHSIKQ